MPLATSIPHNTRVRHGIKVLFNDASNSYKLKTGQVNGLGSGFNACQSAPCKVVKKWENCSQSPCRVQWHVVIDLLDVQRGEHLCD